MNDCPTCRKMRKQNTYDIHYSDSWKFKVGDKLTNSTWSPDEFCVVKKVNNDFTFEATGGRIYAWHYAESDWILYEG